MKPLSLAEVKELAGDLDEKKDLKDYIKKYEKLDLEKSKELLKELKELDSLKVKEEHIVKIVNFLPRRADELNKIFTEVTLDEKEANDILSIVQKY